MHHHLLIKPSVIRSMILTSFNLKKQKKKKFLVKSDTQGEGGGVLHIVAYTGEALPERGTFFRLQVYERVRISQVEVYKREGKSVI